jgi:hypothetical protein
LPFGGRSRQICRAQSDCRSLSAGFLGFVLKRIAGCDNNGSLARTVESGFRHGQQCPCILLLRGLRGRKNTDCRRSRYRSPGNSQGTRGQTRLGDLRRIQAAWPDLFAGPVLRDMSSSRGQRST